MRQVAVTAFSLCACLLAAASPAASAQAQQPAPPAATPSSVRALLAAAGVPADGLDADELDAVPLDFAVETGTATAALAYRVDTVTGRTRLVVRLRDRSAAAWRTASFDGAEMTLGAVREVRELGDWIVVDTGQDDLTGDVLVFDKTLTLHERLPGTLVDVLPGGALLYRENAAEARPALPLAVSIFTPDSRTRARIYPPGPPASSTRQGYADRVRRGFANWGLQRCLAAGHPCNADLFDAFVVSGVRADARGRRFSWITRFGPAEHDTAGPVDIRAYVLVACDRIEETGGAVCRERAFGQYDGPEGPNTLGALAVALTRRGERP